jgi:hypothetical protein
MVADRPRQRPHSSRRVGRAVKGNRVLNSSDDGVSNNSYVGDPGTVHDITAEGNTIFNNVWGRGLEVSGGSSITSTGNYVDNTDGYADVYICSEYQWNTQSVAKAAKTEFRWKITPIIPPISSVPLPTLRRARLRVEIRCWLPLHIARRWFRPAAAATLTVADGDDPSKAMLTRK